jgi:hypothetical protein
MFFIKKDKELDDPRREFLVNALSAGAFVACGSMGIAMPASAGIFGKVPRQVPPGKSIFNLTGEVRVNGALANEDTLIKADDTVETGAKSQAVFVVGKDAFILHSNTKLKISGSGLLLNNLRLFTGRMLSVFGKRGRDEGSLVTVTSTATIGIRGTGVYFESEPDLSYVCTCYGVTNLMSTSDPSSSEKIASQHHDAPRYIAADGGKGQQIRPAPMINHTDLELMLIEELVGRVPPFAVADTDYSAPRRGY